MDGRVVGFSICHAFLFFEKAKVFYVIDPRDGQAQAVTNNHINQCSLRSRTRTPSICKNNEIEASSIQPRKGVKIKVPK